MTLNHVHLSATDVARTRAFYERFFGFRWTRDHGTGVFLRDDGGFLLAIDATPTAVEFPAWFHLGFCLGSEADVIALHRRMVEVGVSFARDLLVGPGEFASFYALDPDGRKIEVSWHAER